MHKTFALLFIPLLLLIAAPPSSSAQPINTESSTPSASDYGFRFVRIRYNSTGSSRWGGRSTWSYDYPAAERNLHKALKRTTDIPLEGEPLVLRLTDDRIFEHPILYLTEPGYWLTNKEEVENMQKFFARGGFMIIDDFHDYQGATPQWDNFYRNIKRVFPDREPVKLDPSHPIWHIYYDIDPVEAASTKSYEGIGKYDDEYYAIFDDNGRMMVIICYNQDIGDGWEWPGRNLANASTVSFQMAINFITYAFTH